VRRWQGPLVNMAWRYCRDAARRRDVPGRFIHAWRGLAQWRRESRFSTWLFALAANVFRSELKRFPTVTLAMDEIAERPGAQRSSTRSRKIMARVASQGRADAAAALSRAHRPLLLL